MGGCEGDSSLLLALGVPHKVLHGCSSLLVRASSQVTSWGSPLCAAEGLHSICDVLLVNSLHMARKTSPVLVGVPLSLGPVTPLMLQQRTQWFLSSCVVVFMLLSHCDARPTHKYGQGLSLVALYWGFLFSCDVVAPSSCCSHYSSCCVQGADL